MPLLIQSIIPTKKSIPALLLLPLLLASPLRAGTIVGSPHDFKGYLWNRSGEICTPCHAPHSTKVLPEPIWDRQRHTQAYAAYRATRTDAKTENERRLPDGMSKKCLSCHDGILAVDSYGGNPAAAEDRYGRQMIGAGRSSNHPISFIYDTTRASKDDGLHDPATRLSGILGSTGTIQTDMLFLNRLECASCHDVHNTKAVPGTKLLVKSNDGSSLCLTCHDKYKRPRPETGRVVVETE